MMLTFADDSKVFIINGSINAVGAPRAATGRY